MPSPTVASSGKLTIRLRLAADTQGILNLLQEIGHPHSVDFWDWFNEGNPFGSTISRVGARGDEIIGYYAVRPHLLKVQGRLLQAGLAVHAAVKPGERNLKTILQLCAEVYEECKRSGLVFLYGFPNDRIWPVKTTLLGWRPVTEIVWVGLPLRALLQRFSRSSFLHTRRIERFQEGHERLWDAAPRAHLIRHAEYLNWRYLDHPEVRYQGFETRGTSGSISGYLVAKIYRKDGVCHGHLVDFCASAQDQFNAVLERLLADACLWFKEQGVEILSCWALPGGALRAVLEEIGFREIEKTAHFGVKPLMDDLPEEVLRPDQWEVSMGDSDAF